MYALYWKFISRFILIAMLVGSSFYSYSDVETVTSKDRVILATHDYSPYYNKKSEGLLADLYRSAFKSVNLKVEFRVFPIGRAVQYLTIDRVDTVSPGRVLLDVTNWSDYTFVDILKIQMCWFYYAPDYPGRNPPEIGDISNYNLSMVNFSPYRKIYQQQQLNIMSVTNPEQHIRLLRRSRVQLSELTRLAGLWAAGKEFMDEAGEFKCIPWRIDEIGLAFNGDTPRSRHLAKMFQQGVATLKKSGEYIEILERYWGRNNIPKELLPRELSEFGTTLFDTTVFYSESIANSIE